MKQLIMACLMASLVSISHAQTQKKVTDLPNISVIGNIVGVSNDHQKTMDVKDIEFSFQHYLYPSVKADVFVGLHKEHGERSLELEEGYVTFLDTLNVVVPNAGLPSGLGTIVGKKLIGFGKINPLHPEQWQFVDRPLLNATFLGKGHGLSAEGGQLSALLPLPFFSQLEWGYWTASAHGHDESSSGHDDHDEAHGVEYENRLMSTRLWNSVSISDAQEVELGFNYLLGNASASDEDDQQAVMGVDITFNQALGDRTLTLQGEFASAEYGEEGEAREKQSASVLTAMIDATKNTKLGLRYDQLGKHGDEGHDVSQLALVVTRQLTETSKFRLQYNSSEELENTVLAQFIFGMGPHSHVLQ